jgi:hypothetical protein
MKENQLEQKERKIKLEKQLEQKDRHKNLPMTKSYLNRKADIRIYL